MLQRKACSEAESLHNIYLIVFIYCTTNNSGGSLGDKTTFTDLMISTTGGEYEPYVGGTASPNPSYPQDIHSISGNNSVKVENKNLIGADNISNLSSATGTYNDNVLTFTSTATYKKVEWFIPVKAGEKYTFSCGGNDTLYLGIFEYSQIATSSDYRLRAIAWDIQITSNGKTSSFTIQNDCYLRVYLGNQAITTTTISNVMLEKGESPTTYVNHSEDTYTLTLGNIEYCKIPNTDYKDLFVRNFGKNLFNPSYQVEKNYKADGTQLGSTYYTNTNGVITNAKDYSNYGRFFFNKLSLEAGTYTISFIPSLSSSEKKIVYSVRNMDTLTDIIAPNNAGVDITDGTPINLSFTINSITNICISMQPKTSNGGTLTIREIMLNKGTTATDYEPYGTNEWYIKKAIGKYVDNNYLTINGITTERIGLLTPELNITPSLSNDNLEAITKCNLMPTKMTGYTNSNGLQGTTSVSKIRVNLNTTYADSIENANTFLTNNSFTIYYVMATPTYTQITGTLANELENIYNAMSKNGTTNISQVNNDLGFVISATLLQDLRG